MLVRVLIILSLLFSTSVMAHDTDRCEFFLNFPGSNPRNAVEEYNQILSDIAQINAEMKSQNSAYLPLAAMVAEKVSLLIRLLDVARRSENEADFRAHYAKFQRQLQAEKSFILLYLTIGRRMSPKSPSSLEVHESAPVDRGAQHPGRPMKRETLLYDPWAGDWPVHFSGSPEEKR